MNKERRLIDLGMTARREIMAELGCSYMAVFRALCYRNDSGMSRRIRKLAMEKGGIVMAVAPEMETLHDAEGRIRQYFPNGAMIEIDKPTGRTVITSPRGKEVGRVEECSIPMLEELQGIAAGLSESV